MLSHANDYAFVFLRALHVLWYFAFILNLALSMASKKQKISDGGQIFEERWTEQYFLCKSVASQSA